jgi:hypothetical protein
VAERARLLLARLLMAPPPVRVRQPMAPNLAEAAAIKAAAAAAAGIALDVKVILTPPCIFH